MDRWLVKRVLSGDRESADRFVTRFYPGIRRFLRQLTRNSEDAEDLAQQTFLEARVALPRFRFECPLRSWLFRIAYRQFLHWKRSQSRRREDALDDQIEGKINLSVETLTLLSAIEDLSNDLRVTFWLCEIERLSVKETAACLEIPEGTVKSRCHLARKRLRDRLADAYQIPGESLEVDHAQ